MKNIKTLRQKVFRSLADADRKGSLLGVDRRAERWQKVSDNLITGPLFLMLDSRGRERESFLSFFTPAGPVLRFSSHTERIFTGRPKNIFHYPRRRLLFASSSFLYDSLAKARKWNCRLARLLAIMNKVLRMNPRSTRGKAIFALFAFNSVKIENKFSLHHISSSSLNVMSFTRFVFAFCLCFMRLQWQKRASNRSHAIFNDFLLLRFAWTSLSPGRWLVRLILSVMSRMIMKC